MRSRVLILCTRNSVRSQMAEGLLRHDAGAAFTVESAGTQPSVVSPEAIAVMREIGIDISEQRSKHVDEFHGQRFDHVITVCGQAQASCPVFAGTAQRLHCDFEDPAAAEGPESARLAAFRRVRDDLRQFLRDFASH